METIPALKPAKKQWQKPDFYLLANSSVAGGNVLTSREIQNGKQSKLVTSAGNIDTFPAAIYNNYQS